MAIDKRIRKRILIFSIAPLLITLSFFVEDLALKIITLSLVVLYVAFIIFLRDSSSASQDFLNQINEYEFEKQRYETTEDETLRNLKRSIKPEIITDENIEFKIVQKQKKPPLPEDIKESYEKIANERIPPDLSHDKQFSFVLEKILTVIKETTLAHSAVFFWCNSAKNKLSIEKYVSSSLNIDFERKFNIEEDIVSSIALKEEPQLLTDILPAAEKDVIIYYKKPQGIKSFVGAPLFYGKSLAAAIALDSKTNDAFGLETIFLLGKFIRVITIIIGLFEEKYAESQAEKRLNGLINLLIEEPKFDKIEDLFDAVERSLLKITDWDAFSFIYYSPLEQNFTALKVINKTSLKYIGEGLKIDLNGTLTGKAILNGAPVKIDDASNKKYYRFKESENIGFEGSFLSIPLVYNDQNYGAICFESLKKNNYSSSEVQFLKNALKILSFIVYSFSAQKSLKKLISIDIETMTLNAEAFANRMSEELYKAKTLNYPSALAVIYIDEFLEQDSLFEANPFQKVLKAISESIVAEITPANLYGRISEREFAVFFINQSSKDVFVWAERLRQKIARKPISIISRQTTFTVSIGIASASNKSEPEEVLTDAKLALKKALEAGGNKVKS